MNDIKNVIVDDGYVSLSRDANHNLTVSIRRFDGGEMVDVAAVVLSPGEIMDFQQNVNQEAYFAINSAVKALAMGDCATCGNARLVPVPGHGGRVVHEHCPDCKPDIRAGFPPVPQIGGGVA